MKKILITGGCGFIGSHVAEKFLKENYKVIIVDNLSTGNIANKPHKAVFYNVDLLDKKKLEKIFYKEKPDLISHHASALVGVRESIINPKKAFTDIEIMINIVDLMKKYSVDHLLFSSSANVYDRYAALPIKEDSKLNPLSPYGVTKMAIESYCNYISQFYGIKITIFRYFNVFGPRQLIRKREGVISNIISSIAKNKSIIIFGDGNQTRDFVYVEDIANANYLAAEKKTNGIFNIGRGNGTSINEIIAINEKIWGKKVKVIYKKSINEIEHSIADTVKAKKYLGWEIKIKFEQGIKKTVAFYKAIQ